MNKSKTKMQVTDNEVLKELENKFKKNLSFFKSNLPEIYNKVFNLKLSKLNFAVSEEGELQILFKNLVIYQGNTKEVCRQQVQNFITQNYKINFTLEKPGSSKLNTLFHEYLKKLHNQDLYVNYEIVPSLLKTVPLLLVLGIGIGYHIEFLLKELDIKHLIIYEPEIELFYLSLHTIDWEDIFNQFKNDKRIYLYIHNEQEVKLEYVVNNIDLIIKDINPIFASYSLIYSHFNDINLVNNLCKKLSYIIYGFGFYDDEKWSIQHTLQNIKQKIPIFINKEKVSKDAVCFIIGAGPSLDTSIEVIKKYKDKAILFSCGSALRTLEKNNIFPDFHIEIERTKEQTYESLKLINLDYLKQIAIIGNNTIPVEAFELFKEKYMFLKDEDAGADLFNNLYYKVFNGITVGDMAVILAVFLGFKNIYLFGLDLGYKDPTYHHSKYNLAMDNNTTFYVNSLSQDFKVCGNFGGIFYTNRLFFWVKNSLEEFLFYFKNDSNIYNCSDGVEIRYTIPLLPKYLNLDNVNFDKHIILNTIKSNFSSDYCNDIDFNLTLEKYLKNIDSKIDKIFELLNTKLNNRFEIIDIFYKIYQLVKNEILIRGSILHFQNIIYIYTFSFKIDNEAINFIDKAFLIFKEFLIKVKEDIKTIK